MGEYPKVMLKGPHPKGVILGHIPNHWGVNIPGQVGQGCKEAHLISGLTIGQFIKELGPVGMGDVVFVEKTDHDAGHKPTGENWLWDSTGYAKYFLWTRAISNRCGLPIVGWQVSEGNMNHPAAANKDNAVETFLSHPGWWLKGGFIGILFGAGNSCCANYKNDNDNGWFVNHIKEYNQKPYEFPATVIIKNNQSNVISNKLTIKQHLSCICLSGWNGLADVEMHSLSGQLVSRARLFSGGKMPMRSVRPGLYKNC